MSELYPWPLSSNVWWLLGCLHLTNPTSLPTTLPNVFQRSHAISHLYTRVQALLSALCELPCWHGIYSQGIISNIISSTKSFLIPAADSNCFICTLTALRLDLSSNLNHLLPTIVIICVRLLPLWSQRGFEGGTVSDSSLFLSRFPGPNTVPGTHWPNKEETFWGRAQVLCVDLLNCLYVF